MNNPSMVIVLLGCLTTSNARLLNFGPRESKLKGTDQMKVNSTVSIASSFDSDSNVDRLQGLLYEEKMSTALSRIIPLDLIKVKNKGIDRVGYQRDMFGVTRASFFGIRLPYSSQQTRETTPLIRMKREIDFTDPVVQELLRFYMKHQKGKGRYGSRWG
ncbi:hypothetical protein ACJMK2_017026 [Sinanodonta woodiana]|uniref:Uncharacterized protein n=1 Tax=Sinanodonta woodiana TaxID=1069815 RepID=A0ABD3UVL1_SINWO